MNKVISFPPCVTNANARPLRSLDDLILGCKAREKAAFDELIKRYMGLIIKEIRRVFRSLYIEHLAKQEDVAQDILLMITEKAVRYLIKPPDPPENEFHNPRAFPKWLKKITESQTFEWLRQQNRQNNVIKKRIQALTGSLDNPLDLYKLFSSKNKKKILVQIGYVGGFVKNLEAGIQEAEKMFFFT